MNTTILHRRYLTGQFEIQYMQVSIKMAKWCTYVILLSILHRIVELYRCEFWVWFEAPSGHWGHSHVYRQFVTSFFFFVITLSFLLVVLILWDHFVPVCSHCVSFWLLLVCFWSFCVYFCLLCLFLANSQVFKVILCLHSSFVTILRITSYRGSDWGAHSPLWPLALCPVVIPSCSVTIKHE